MKDDKARGEAAERKAVAALYPLERSFPRCKLMPVYLRNTRDCSKNCNQAA